MSDMRAHILLTADGRQVVGAARGSEAALSQLRGTVEASGQAAARSSGQFEQQNRAMAVGRRMALLLTSALGGLAAGFSAKSIVDASLRMDGIESSLLGVFGSAQKANGEIRFLREESERLGIVFDRNALAFTRTAAAAKGTALEGAGVRDIWLAISEANVVLQRSTADTEGALYAVEQMISKGTVTAEELKRQLGDRLPGAFQIAAQAMGVSTEELTRMLEAGELMAVDFLPKFAAQLRTQFGDGLEAAIGKPRAELNRLANDLFDFQVEVASGGFMEGLVDGSDRLRDALGDEGFRAEARALFSEIGSAAALAGDGAVLLAENVGLIKTGVLGLIGLKFVSWINAGTASLKTKAAAFSIARQKTIAQAQADLVQAKSSAVAANSEVYRRKMQLATAKTTTAATIATVKLTQAQTAAAAASVRLTAAHGNLARATGVMAAATRLGAGAMAALGGPLGVAVVGYMGVTAAMDAYEKATAAKITQSRTEIGLIEDLNGLQDQLIGLSRETADATLTEAEAIRERARARRDDMIAAREALADRFSGRIGDQAQRIIKTGFSPATRAIGQLWNEVEDQSRVSISAIEAELLGLVNDPRLKFEGPGEWSVDFGVLKDAMVALSPAIDDWSERTEEASAHVAAIRARIGSWEKAETSRSTKAKQSSIDALAQYRQQLQLTTDQAGMTEEAAAIEKIAIDLVNKSKKAGIELTLEAARVEASRHVQARSSAEARLGWAEEERNLQEQLRAATETDQQTDLRRRAQELYQAAQEAGIKITREQIRARLDHIATLEDEFDAQEELREAQEAANDRYEEWLEDREIDLELAALTREEREVEALAIDKVNLAAEAGIVITRDAARAWAEGHVDRLDQLEREARMIQNLPEAYEQAADDVQDLWNNTWEDIWNGNFDSVKDFAGDMLGIFKRLAKQIAAQMIIKPILNSTGLGAALGIPGLGQAGGIAGVAGGQAGLLGGVLGSALGGANGFLTGLPVVGGLLSGASGAITAGLGALPGIGGALAGISAALGPVGLIAGAVFGLTSILKKTPRLKSYFGTTAGGDIGIRSSETRGVDDQATDEIAEQINTILDRLGVTLTGSQAFTVLFKPEKDYLDVNFGDGRHFQGGADDADAAVAFAVSELLKGPVEGLSSELQEVIRSAGRITDPDQLDALIGGFQNARTLAEQIEAELQRRNDPDQYALDQLAAAQAARRSEIESFRDLGYVADDVFDQLSQLEALELDEVMAQLSDGAVAAGGALSQAARDARIGIGDWLEDLRIANDNSPLSVLDRRQNALSAYNAQLALAQGGDVDALSSLTEYADNLLSLDREATSSAASRAVLYNSVVSDLEALAIEPALDTQTQILNELRDTRGDIIGSLGDNLPAAIVEPLDQALLDSRNALVSSLSDVEGEFGILSGDFDGVIGNLDVSLTQRLSELLAGDQARAALLETGNDNVVQALNDNLTNLRTDMDGVRVATEGVVAAVQSVGANQQQSLLEIALSTGETTRLLEQSGSSSDGINNGTNDY